MGNNEQTEIMAEQAEAGKSASLSKEEEKAARKARMRTRRLARRAKRNARIARGRTLKNFIIWLTGFVCLPVVIVVASLVVPISVITGNDGKYISQDLSKRSVFEAVKFVAGNPGDLGFADLPIITKALADLQDKQIGEKDDGAGGKTPIKIGDLIHIDTEKLNTIKFGSSDVAGEIGSCIEVVATIESLGGASALGDFGSFSVFTNEEEAGTVAEIDAREETADVKKQYYYKSTGDTVVYDAAEIVYLRAFNDDGTLVAALAALSETEKNTVKLYYPPLEKVKLGELKSIVGDSIGRITIKSLLDTLGGSNAKLIDIIGTDTTIKGLKDFDINEVKLDTVLPAPDTDHPEQNKKLYDVLRDATGVDGATEDEKNHNIKIGDLSTIQTDDICLNTVLPATEQNKTLYDILKDLTGKTEAEIKVNDLKDLSTDDLHLNIVLEDNASNEKLYNILKDLSNKDSADILISDLKNLNTDNLRLSVVLPAPDNSADPESDAYKQNRKLYDILLDITPNDVDEYGEITVGNLSSIDTDKLHLNTVMGNVSDNKVLTALKAKDITVGNIGTALNGLSLYEVYGNEAFTTTPIAGARRFNKSTYNDRVCYDYDPAGDYYLDTTAGIWLVLCYDTVTYNTDESVNTRFVDSAGNPTKYIADELTIGDLQNGNSFSKKFRNATLKQLIDTKLVNGDDLGGTLSDKTQKMSLQEIIEILASTTVQDYINSH